MICRVYQSCHKPSHGIGLHLPSTTMLQAFWNVLLDLNFSRKIYISTFQLSKTQQCVWVLTEPFGSITDGIFKTDWLIWILNGKFYIISTLELSKIQTMCLRFNTTAHSLKIITAGISNLLIRLYTFMNSCNCCMISTSTESMSLLNVSAPCCRWHVWSCRRM